MKINPSKKTIDFVKAMNFINPILLYTFTKTLYNEFSDLSLVFLIMFCSNLVLTSELRQFLMMNENDIFGWKEIKENGRK